MIYIFLGDKNEVQEFVSILNNFDENLEFTLEINFSRVHFLDIKKWRQVDNDFVHKRYGSQHFVDSN